MMTPMGTTDPAPFSEWLDGLDDAERARLLSLAEEYANAIVSTYPAHDLWLAQKGMVAVLLAFFAEAAGLSDGLAVTMTRSTPWSA
jgi:hypothetical protein